MAQKIFSFEEILETAKLDQAVFEEWLEDGLIQSMGQTPEQIPFFSVETLEKIEHIKRFQEMGYSSSEIKKILRKVGLPESQKERAASSNRDQFLTVGVLAEQVGVSPRTIKHWEDKGIIEADMRSQGGFRLYRNYYVFFCQLILDLQLFGYSLEEIKRVSQYFRVFDQIRTSPELLPPQETDEQLGEMLEEISNLFEKIEKLKSGIARWEDLLKKHRKQIANLKTKNKKRLEEKQE